ncbi:MAG TPA: hypothetical protein VGO67_20900 [Verrucomicrobiae bacterium]|jgi:hypothetical protein
MKRVKPQYVERPSDAAGKRLRIRGLTILEMLVSTAMLSFIVLGLTAMFIQTQKAFKTGIKAATVTDAGRTVMDMIAADMRHMSDGNNPGITNLYWSWSGNSVQSNAQFNPPLAFRTNQVDAIYILEHTNTMWMGVGYAVQNLVPNSGATVGTLYRFETNFSAPYLLTNNLFVPFETSVATQNFTNMAYWHRVADGVVSLKLFAYDQNGREPGVEAYYGDWEPQGSFSYPLSTNGFRLPNNVDGEINTLPNAVDVELAILEPDALIRARALASIPSPSPAFLRYMGTNAPTTMEIFRRRVSIPVVAR